MATAGTEGKILKEISEDFLCCTICLELYTTPKILPCLHTFCQQCLVTLVAKTGSLTCPECRQKFQIPVGQVPSLKGNFFMASLVDNFKRRMESVRAPAEVKFKCEACQENTATHRCVECKHYLCNSCVQVHSNLSKTHRLLTIEEFETTKSSSPVTLQAVEYCSVHTKNEIEFYCDTCQVPVCTNCTIDKHRIPEHVYRDLKDAADEYLRDLAAMVDKLKVKEQEAEKNKSLAKQIHSDLTEQRKREERKVTMKAEEEINRIKREEQRLVDELNNIYKMKLKTAAVCIDELELKHGNIKNACSYVETLMHHGHAAQLLSTKGDAEHRIKQLITMETKPQARSEEVVFQPSVDFNEQGILGLLTSDVCISKCTVENVPKQLLKGDSADLLITTRDSTGKQVAPTQPVKAKLRKPDASWEDLKVSDNRDGTHRLTVDGKQDGKYQVAVTIGDQPVPGSPVSIPVIKGLVQSIGCEGSAEGQYDRPLSVALNKDKDIVTADTDNNRLQITTRQGRVKKILKFTQFEKPFRPLDVSVSSDNTHYSLDNKNKQVVVSDENGRVIRCFGQNELKDPQGISICPVSGNVYVTDQAGACVLIYSQHGKYIRSFGSFGKGQGKFMNVWGIEVASNGMVFVADYGNKRVQVFNSDDKYLYSFGCQSGDGELRSARGITTENDKYVYVSTDIPSSILKFEIGGKFVCRIDCDGDKLNRPTGMALTDDVPCRVIVADYGNHCIKVFVQ